jgi:hypothetical protein
MITLSRASVLASGALALLWLAPSAQAAEMDQPPALVAGHVLVCDTPEEVEAVLASQAGDIAARLSTVNARFGKQACDVVTAVFYRGDEAKIVLSSDGVVRIIKVAMLGVRAGESWMRLARPVSQYAGVLEDSTGV